jgi:hypothetical protein
MEATWFNVTYYKSLGDIYTKYGYLNLKDDVMIDLIDDECNIFLSNKLRYNREDMRYFSYNLKYDKSGDMITIMADNILCALWFIGVFPTNNKRVLKENRFENRNFIYTFDKISCKLKSKRK